MPTTPSLLADHIVQNQSQKEVTANAALDVMDKAIAETADVAVGGGAGDSTLTLAEMRPAILRFTGVLTGNRNVIVPNRDKIYRCVNDTSGAFTLTIKTAAGSGVVLEQGFKTTVYCDGTNVLEFDYYPRPYRTITGTSNTIRITDKVIYMDATGGNVSCTLPAASTAIGREILFIRVDSSANTCTINRAGADDINNAATSKTITNTIGTAALFRGFSSTRWMAQTLAAA